MDKWQPAVQPGCAVRNAASSKPLWSEPPPGDAPLSSVQPEEIRSEKQTKRACSCSLKSEALPSATLRSHNWRTRAQDRKRTVSLEKATHLELRCRVQLLNLLCPLTGRTHAFDGQPALHLLETMCFLQMNLLQCDPVSMATWRAASRPAT